MSNDGINWKSVEEYLSPIRARMAQNVAETGHPFHHLTRNGAIIDRDPRVPTPDEFTYLWLGDIPVGIPKPWSHPRKAIPHIPDWYATKAGTKWLKRQSDVQTMQAQPARPQQQSLWE